MSTNGNHSVSPNALFASVWQHRNLIWHLTKREVAGRYRGSFMGLTWAFFLPILLLLIYTFVFTVVFNARWGSGNVAGKEDFAIFLFVGLIIHGILAECLSKSPATIINNANYVKKIVFPLEILPWVTLLSAIFHAFISFCIAAAFILYLKSSLELTILYLPVVIMPLILVCAGLFWFLSSFGVFVRDIGHITSLLITGFLFLAPVFYPLSVLPEKFQAYMYINPLTLVIEQARNVVLYGVSPDWGSLGIYTGIAFIVAYSGFWWFQKTRKGFADVL